MKSACFCSGVLILVKFVCFGVAVFNSVCLEIGLNIGNHIKNRIVNHLKIPSVILYKNDSCMRSPYLQPGALILALGNSSTSTNLIRQGDLNLLPFESFRAVSKIDESSGAFMLACNGRPLDPNRHRNITFNKEQIHYGAVVSAYACLELLGFGFLHPLAVYAPPQLDLDITKIINLTEIPYWPSRVFHIHTQHPLELTEVLQGMDIPIFGPHGPHCQEVDVGSDPGQGKGMYCERWEDMVEDVDKFFEWSVANRLNAVEWLLLGNYKWGDFDTSDTRMKRLRILTGLGHEYSLLVGADAPLGNIQQHAWHMVNVRLPFEEQVKQLRSRVDWIFSAGFDFLTTESGLSEFTHPECDLMLDLLNEYATYVNVTWGREAAVKVHCSTGQASCVVTVYQTCEQFADPRTGEPINFNFLPMFAVPQLGVLPHTVQMYGLDDPTGGSYGNAENFAYIEDYMFLEAETGNRSVVFYGETAYWVNVDIDVPLFLPIYGQRRLKDLRRIARREVVSGHRVEGQMNFDSGWEWGYWVNDVVTARASWNPFPGDFGDPRRPSEQSFESKESNDSCAVVDKAEEEWIAFSVALQPITRIFGEKLGMQLNDLLVRLTRIQADLLIFGTVDGRPCPNSSKLTGIAYLSGSDTWVDLPRMVGIPFTQPDKVHMDEAKDPLWPHVMPLLEAMENEFTKLSNEMKNILENAKHSKDSLKTDAIDILMEVDDCIRLLSLRASQIRMLYASSDMNTSSSQKAQLQTSSRALLADAAKLVASREKAYRVPWQRVASWRDNPTVYRFGYLWSVHSLYYWWRDQGLAEQGSLQSERSPCYLNRMDASEVAVGWGKYTLELLRNLVHRYTPFLSGYSAFEFLNCISPPDKEYLFPQDLYHY